MVRLRGKAALPWQGGGEVKPSPAYKPTGLAWLLDRMFERAKEIAAA